MKKVFVHLDSYESLRFESPEFVMYMNDNNICVCCADPDAHRSWEIDLEGKWVTCWFIDDFGEPVGNDISFLWIQIE